MKSRWSEFDTISYAAAFITIFLVILDEYFLDFPTRLFLIEKSGASLLDQSVAAMYFTFDFLLLFFFIRESFLARTLLKVVYGLIFAVALFTEYSYHRLFGRFISEVDFELVASSPAAHWLSAFNLHFSFYALIPVGIFCGLLVLIRPPRRRHDFLCFFSVVALLFLSSLRPTLANVTAEHLFAREATPPLLRFYQSVFRFIALRNEITIRSAIPDFVTPSTPKDNVVIVIDESIRADHLSLNGYARDTTPYLRVLEREGRLRNFGTATAGATCSPLSNAMLITGTAPSSESYRDVFKRPTIFQFAKNAGYRTTYIDAQTDTLWTGLSSSDLKYIDRWVRGSELGEFRGRDLHAAALIRDVLGDTSTFNLIVVNKRGVHFMYEDSYPKSEERWGPLPPEQDYLRHRELVTNPYDNGIRYSVDGFFQALLGTPLASIRSTVFIYTSDHGQTLFEEGASWLHCNDRIIEAEVPLFLVGDPAIIGSLTMEPSHKSIVPTALHLMGIPTEVFDSSAQERKGDARRCFVSGSLQVVCHK